jgi:hypothetical protein
VYRNHQQRHASSPVKGLVNLVKKVLPETLLKWVGFEDEQESEMEVENKQVDSGESNSQAQLTESVPCLTLVVSNILVTAFNIDSD